MVRLLCLGQPAFIAVTTPAVVGEETKIAHGLGRVPVGWSIIKGDRAAAAGDNTAVGTIVEVAGALPSGYLECNGAAVSRTTYASLFVAIGSTFGAGDGSTTFNVPDFRGRVAIGAGTGTGGGANGTGAPAGGAALTARTAGQWMGAETHTLTLPEIPAHTHDVYYDAEEAQNGNDEEIPADFASSGGANYDSGSAGGGGAHNNVQPALVVTKAIKYAPTAGNLASTTEWTDQFIYLKFASASAAITLAVF